MTDRELLEAAAKAAGIILGEHARFIGDHPQLWFQSDARNHPMCRKPNRAGNVPWNPLLDDGDALRLAVKMDMDINIESAFGHTRANEFFEDHGTDPGAATRRAIVRAAAEIGKMT